MSGNSVSSERQAVYLRNLIQAFPNFRPKEVAYRSGDTWLHVGEDAGTECHRDCFGTV
jgi:hypothetical protein